MPGTAGGAQPNNAGDHDGFVSRLSGDLRTLLRPFFTPYHEVLQKADPAAVLGAMKLDKKNVGGRINCILTRGPGRMERTAIESEEALAAHLRDFIGLLP